MISWALSWYAIKSGNQIDESMFFVTGFFDVMIVFFVVLGLLGIIVH